jgi:hypothetical protein
MDKQTKGAWLLSQSKNLDSVVGATRFENIAYAGKIGRLYNVLRRGTAEDPASHIDADTVTKLCQLNNIDLAARREGLRILNDDGRISIESDGSVVVLGATTRAVLETASEIYDSAGPSTDENAVLDLSQKISERPQERKVAEQFIGDTHRLPKAAVAALIDLSRQSALIDQENDKDRIILFNSNTFRDKGRAKKAYFLLESLSAADAARVTEMEETLRRQGTVYDAEVEKILGSDLYRRLVSIGYFDRMEVNNDSEAVGYLALPDAFQRYGRPFEEDPVDDAKALLSSLTYGMNRSSYSRGQVTLPTLLLRKLISGGIVGDQKPVRAIGEDYKELEKRGVVQVIPAGFDRYRMKLLKKDVGELALAIVSGRNAAEEALLMSTSAATSFKGPDENRKVVRSKNTVNDKRFVTDALDRLRSGDY